MSNSHKNIIKVFEFISVLIILSIVCFYINRGIVLKGIYKDDLYDWSWFRDTSFFDFAIKFYKSSHYRPVFESIQFLIYNIVGTDPFRFTFINKIYNIIVAIFIYYFVNSLDAGAFISILSSLIYLISHYAYYQIGQAIGPLETTALLLSLIILYLSICLVKKSDTDSHIKQKSHLLRNLISMYVLYFLLVFDHERYLSVASIIILSIVFSDKFKYLKDKIIALLIFICEIGLILYIRFAAIGSIIPAGTGGTHVEDTFNISQFVEFCKNQVLIIFGINIGPEHLFGVDFASIENIFVKRLTIASIIVILLVLSIYLICKVRYIISENKDIVKECASDVLFIIFILSLIISTSVTIRIELRFVYTSFIALIIYLAYMYGYLMRHLNGKYVSILLTGLFISVFIFRIPIELLYRSYFDKIYCYVDAKRINSLYDNTIGTYGLDEILHKKNIYIINKYYDMTNFYAEYFYKIYDENNVGNTIRLVNDISDIDVKSIDDDSVILFENFVDNTYVKIDIRGAK